MESRPASGPPSAKPTAPRMTVMSGSTARPTTSAPAATRAPVAKPMATGSMGMAVLLGVGAALLGALTWGVLGKLTEREFGILAWAVGALCGVAVWFGAGKRRSIPLASIAVGCSLLGILVGKYLIFAFIVSTGLADAGVELGVFSGGMFRLFAEFFGDLWGLLDILFVALAVSSAFKLTFAPSSETPPAKPRGPAA